MDYHLVVKYKNSQKLFSSFSESIFPEIDEYVKKTCIHKLTHLEIGIEDIVKMASKITSLLNTFFTHKYIHKEYKLFRAKSIQKVTYLEKVYYLHIGSVEHHRIQFLELLNQIIKNNGIIILYGKDYLEYKLVQILRCINEEELKNKRDIIARIDAIKHPNFNVNEALKELEQKEFITINQELVVLTKKGEI